MQTKFFSATTCPSSRQVGISFKPTPSMTLNDLRLLISDLEDLKTALKRELSSVGDSDG